MAALGSGRRLAQQELTRKVRPLLSRDESEARHRVLALYKAWHRQIPFMMRRYDLPISSETAYRQLRKKFEENKHVQDVRVIDMLVIKVSKDDSTDSLTDNQLAVIMTSTTRA